MIYSDGMVFLMLCFCLVTFIVTSDYNCSVIQDEIQSLPSWDGSYLTPQSSSYTNQTCMSNPRVQSYPCLVLLPRNHDAVAQAVTILNEHMTQFRIKGGGHSYEGYSIWPGVVLSMSSLVALKVDFPSGTFTAGAGVRWQEVYETLDGTSWYALGGHCPTVGVVAYILGGGENQFTGRQYGMGLNNVVEFVMVTTNGTIVMANNLTNSDLFWGLRGAGGGNLGIIVQVTVKMHNNGNLFPTFWHYYEGDDLIRDTLYAWTAFTQTIMKENEPRLQFSALLDTKKLTIEAFWSDGNDTVDEFHRWINSWHVFSPPPTSSEFHLYTWWQFDLATQGTKYSWGGRIRWTSSFVDVMNTNIVNTILSSLPLNTNHWVELYFFQGSNKQTPTTEIAYPWNPNYHIASCWKWQHETDDQSMLKYGDIFLANMNLTSAVYGSYINYIDNRLPEWPTMYYGKSLSRLQHLKHKWDPTNLLAFPQGII